MKWLVVTFFWKFFYNCAEVRPIIPLFRFNYIIISFRSTHSNPWKLWNSSWQPNNLLLQIEYERSYVTWMFNWKSSYRTVIIMSDFTEDIHPFWPLTGGLEDDQSVIVTGNRFTYNIPLPGESFSQTSSTPYSGSWGIVFII